MRTVALIGPDGAGKSTIAREIVRGLSVRARHIYMGTNPNSSNHMLPTTRLAHAIKRARRASTAAPTAPLAAGGRPGRPSVLRHAYRAARALAVLAEQWYRAGLSMAYTRRGDLVVFDRHPLYDYWPGTSRAGSAVDRAHRRLLRGLYPRPDLVICLDAPAELLHQRKREQSVEALERVRQNYLALADIGPEFLVVDAARPLPSVIADVRAAIEARLS